LYEEEGDVTEIYFILKGDWGIGFNCFTKDVEGLDDAYIGSQDMTDRGILFARRAEYKTTYIGDYYVLGSKKSAFFYITEHGC